MKKEDLDIVMVLRLDNIIEQAKEAKKKLKASDNIHHEVNCLTKGVEFLNYDFKEAVRLDFY